jgi:uncharacterized delta-60 repeat protein
LDPTFGTLGRYIPPSVNQPPGFIVPTDFAVYADGRILVSGYGLHDVGTVFRLTADGNIDPTFYFGNILAGSNHGGYFGAGNAVAIGPGGKIAVAGVNGPLGGAPDSSTVVLYKPDGTLDNAFGGHGFVDTKSFGAGFSDVVFQGDGKILAVGKKLVRFNTDGTVDATFGGGDGAADVIGRKVAVDRNGKIVVLGNHAIFRFNADGSADASFDGDGIRPNVNGTDFAFAPDGDLLVANDARFVTRFNANGSIDAAFGQAGSVTVFGANSVASSADRVYVGSTVGSGLIPYDDWVVNAFTQTGQIDVGFANGGRAQTDMALNPDRLIGLALQKGDKLLAMGVAGVRLDLFTGPVYSEPGLARYQLTTAPPPTGTQLPYSSNPAFLPGTIELENFDRGGEGVAFHDADGANLGGAYRPLEGVDLQTTTDTGGGTTVAFVKAGEWLEYTVDVVPGGSYDVDFRVASLKAGGKFHLEVDGKDVTGPLGVPQTGDWNKYATVTKTGLNLSVGRHVVRLAFDANGSLGYVGNFNWLRLRPGTGPAGQQPYFVFPFTDADQVPARSFDRGGEGVAYHDTEAANLGGALRPDEGVDIEPMPTGGSLWNVGWTRPGEWLEYTMDFNQSGRFDLNVNLASQGGGARFRVLVDDQAVASFTTPDTAGWQTYATVTRSGVNVAQGRHVIRIQIDSAGPTGYGPNLAYFEFKKV